MAKKTSKKKELLTEVIIAYRKAINDRYQFENIEQNYDVPESFDSEKVDLFRDFFLNYIYPEPAKREELNAAFENLDDYIKYPSKLLHLILDSTRLIFKYGRHLPKILNAGLKALRSFRMANEFEDKLVGHAQSLKLKPPFGEEDVNALIRELKEEEIERFIKNNEALFGTLHDRKLVAKILEVVEFLIGKMKKNTDTYSPAEIRGMEIGHEIIQGTNELFDQLTDEDQKLLFEFVIQLERDQLEAIYNNV